MNKILLPIEQNPQDKEVICEAVEIAKKFNSKLILFSVDNSKAVIKDLKTGGLINSEELFRRTQDSVLSRGMQNMHDYKYESVKDTRTLKQIKDMYAIEGVDTEMIILEKDDPASAIIDESEKGEYDLIIMKSHKLKKRSRFTLGSVTNKVVHHVKIPILIVR